MDMLCGERTSLLFLVVGHHDLADVMPSFSLWFDSSPTQTALERYLSEQTDVLLHLPLSQARHIKKHYPDNALLIACVGQEDLIAFLGEAITLVDYVVSPDHLQVLAGIIQAEQSRRSVLNAQARLLPRYIYQDTATAILLDHARTHILLIKRNDNGRWFPPGGHVERGEFPYQAVLREIREETGYNASFLFQPPNMGEHFDSATIPPQPYAILIENIETHLHHDFLYLCTVTEQRGKAEGETRWFSLEEVQELPTVPEDVRRVAASLQKTGSPSLVCLDDTEKALPLQKKAQLPL